MNRIQLEKYFSTERLNRYFRKYPGNEAKCMYLYEANIVIAEALYPSLSILEVALRNKADAVLKHKYGREDWYTDWHFHPVLRYAWPEINKTIYNLHEERKKIDHNKIIAGLMFGFWTSLFNDRYERELWSSLRFVFPHMPKDIRQRKNISNPLNDIRRALRNRIYHNEPIIFNITALNQHYSNIVLLLDWMGADLLEYNNSKDRFPEVLDKIKRDLEVM